MLLRAIFIPDERTSHLGLYTGARCDLPGGKVVEVSRRRTPLYDLARELEKRGYGDCRLQAYTPAGTPSLRGLVRVMAGLAISERDGRGLRCEKYRPFPVRGQPAQRDLGSEGTRTPDSEEKRVPDSTAHQKAA